MRIQCFVFIVLLAKLSFSQQGDAVLIIDGATVADEQIKNDSLKPYQEFYASGILKISGFKKNGKFEGTCYYYNKRGVLTHFVKYKKGNIYFEKYYNHKNNEINTYVKDSIY